MVEDAILKDLKDKFFERGDFDSETVKAPALGRCTHPTRKYFDPSEAPHLEPGQNFGSAGVEIDGVRYRNFTVAEDNGLLYMVSHRAILTISLTPVCNAACSFCYNGITFFPYSHRLKVNIGEELDRVLRFARNGSVQHVSLSGGEPTLFPELLLTITRRVRAAFPGFVRLHTNGTGLLRLVNGAPRAMPLVDLLQEAGLSDMSISRAAIEIGTNERIMKMREGSTISDPELNELAARFPDMRLSCFFTKEGVNSSDEMLRYLEWGLRLGVSRFVFRLSSTIGLLYAIPGAFDECNRNQDYLSTKILRDCLLSHGFTCIQSRQCDDHDFYILARDGIEVSIDRSSDVPDPDRKIRRLLYMPNDVCYTSWLQGGATLFPEETANVVHKLNEGSTMVRGHFPAAKARAAYYTEREGDNIDLHVHSTLSDGVHPASAVIEKLKSAGISTACFTDHNCVHDRFDQLSNYARDRDVDVSLPGSEISVIYDDPDGNDARYKIHVLVYGDGVRDKAFLKWVAQANEPRRQHLIDLYNAAKATGLCLPEFDEIFRTDDPVRQLDVPKKMYTRSPLAKAISVANGLSVEEAKMRYLPQIEQARNERDLLSVFDLLDSSKKLGFATIIAHPGWVRDYSQDKSGSFDGVLEMILKLSVFGLDGIELRHRQNDDNQRKKLLKLAQSADLLTTGGSDYHGNLRCVLGENSATREEFDRLLDRIAAKQSGIEQPSL